MTEKQRNIAVGILALAAIIAFIGIAVYYLLGTYGFVAVKENNVLGYIWNGVAAVVGAYVAATFGVQRPPDPTSGGGDSESIPPQSPIRTATLRLTPLQALGVAAVPAPEPTKIHSRSLTIIGGLYLFGYIAVGLVCAVSWAVKQEATPELVRVLASGFVALALTVVSGALRMPSGKT